MLNRLKPKRKEPASPNPPQIPEGMMLVKKEDQDKLISRLDALEKGSFGEPRVIEKHIPAPAPAPSSPSGPSVKEQVADIDKKLVELSSAIDTAIKDEKPIGELLQRQNTLTNQRTGLLLDNQFQNFQQMGLEMMSSITDNLPHDFPYLEVESVKKTYDEYVQGMPPEQKANPMARQIAYQQAVGANAKAITDHERAKWEASMVDEQGKLVGQLPGLKVPVTDDDKKGKITPADLDPEAQVALDYAGRTGDEVARKMGYASWDDYMEQTKIEEEPIQ